MVTTETAKIQLMKLLAGETANDLSSSNAHMAYGDGTTNTNSTDTALGNELNRYAVSSVNRNGKELKLIQTLNSLQLNGNDIKEIGIFDASTSGNLFNRANIATISKTNTVEIEVEYTLKLL